MSLAEVMLRVGCALVAWLLVYAHGLLLAVAPLADCSPALWRSTALFAGLAGVAAGLLGAGRPWRETLRWLALPAALLWIAGARLAAGLLGPATFGAASLCDALAGDPAPDPAAAWERAWAPLQLLAIGLCALRAAGIWRAPAGSR